MIDGAKLRAMSRIALGEADQSELVNIQDIKIDTSLTAPQRMMDYLNEIKNPYCFKCGDVIVKVIFSKEGGELSDLLVKYFVNLKR